MQKKLEAELVSLAHNILQMKNKDDIEALKDKAQELYERLSVLAFVDEYLDTKPNAVETKEELISKIDVAVKEEPVAVVKELLDIAEVEVKNVVEVVDLVEEPTTIEEVVNLLEEKDVEVEEEVEVKEETGQVVNLFEEEEIEIEEEINVVVEKEKAPVLEEKRQLTLEEEFKDAVSADVTTNLFTKFEETLVQTKPSLNDKLRTNIQVGLNDRIAFVKHLFNHSQADFNRVISQLNSFKTEKEAVNFVKKMVKPDYDWTGKEEYEERFITLIERKFL